MEQEKKPGDTPPTIPEPVTEPGQPEAPVKEPPAKPEPTRFGDWERNGRCIDF